MSHSIIQNSRFHFHGGVHPPQNKHVSNTRKSQVLIPSKIYRIPLQQSSIPVNNIAENLIVKKDQFVVIGEALTNFKQGKEGLGVPVHSPCNGFIQDIGEFYCGHPSGINELAIIIKADESITSKVDNSIDTKKTRDKIDWHQQTSESLLNKIYEAGIVGLGGATFPTHVKQSASFKKAYDNPPTLIINAMECEPYITCDDRLLQEEADSIIQGALITAKIMSSETVIFAIEDNKKEAIQQLQNMIQEYTRNHSTIKFSILVAPVIYPSGSEKQLITLVTGKELSSNTLPKDLNLSIQNVATIYAIFQAVVNNKNLTERLVTITGDLVTEAGNYWIPFGTSIKDILKYFNVSQEQFDEFIVGGPMMGQKLSNLDTPITKKTNCLIFNQRALPKNVKECIRCSECSTACPQKLLPQQLYLYSRSEQWKELEQYNLESCIECGICDYVCPSHLPLVDYFKFAKSAITTQSAKEKSSLIAKQRFEQRALRLERVKREKKIKHKRAAEERKKSAENQSSDPDGKKAAILAALNRVKNKSTNVDTSTNEEDKSKEGNTHE